MKDLLSDNDILTKAVLIMLENLPYAIPLNCLY